VRRAAELQLDRTGTPDPEPQIVDATTFRATITRREPANRTAVTCRLSDSSGYRSMANRRHYIQVSRYVLTA